MLGHSDLKYLNTFNIFFFNLNTKFSFTFLNMDFLKQEWKKYEVR